MRADTILLLLVSLPVAIAQQPEAGDLSPRRAAYATVAANLAAQMHDGSAPAPPALEAATLEGQERWRVIVLNTIKCSDPRVVAVAEEGAAAHNAVLALAQDVGDPTAGLQVLTTLATQTSPLALLAPLLRAAGKEEAKKDHVRSVVRRRRAVSGILPELAKTVAGAPVEKDPVAIDFDENWFVPQAPDRIKLTNKTGGSMTRCTVQVDIRGRNGTWVRNVHFVPEWPAGKELSADYFSSGSDATDLSAIGATSAIEVQEVMVSVWCDELRREEQKLHYVGPARDEDMLRALNKTLDVRIDYVAQPFTERGPSLGVTFSGVTYLPAYHATLVCCGDGGKEQKFEFERPGWRGERHSYATQGVLRDCPKTVEVVLRLNMLGQDWKKTVEIASRR